jgi:hypothetical protein
MRATPWSFNPRPKVETVVLDGGAQVLVVDDALVDPQAARDYVVAHRAKFVPAPFNAFPGLEFPAPRELEATLADFFRAHVRPRIAARRLVKMNARFGLVTLPPEELQPRQWICHRDSAWIDPAHAIAASVLYLFKDPALGGTGFYASRLSPRDTDKVVHASGVLPADEFARRFPIPRGYPGATNEFFLRLGGIEPRFNRLIFYDGRQFHSGDIAHPELLREDPARGRLTLNGFFTCTRPAA